MPSLMNLDHLLKRVQAQIEAKKKRTGGKSLERSANEIAKSIYEREELWEPVCIHRWYEIQRCDCCQGEQKLFDGDRVELRHLRDKSARRWLRERGELMADNLPIEIHVVERIIPECWDCFTVGRSLDTIFAAASMRAKLEKFLSKE